MPGVFRDIGGEGELSIGDKPIANQFDNVPLDEASMLVAGLGPRFRKLHEHGFGDFAGEMIAQDKASIATDKADIF